MRRPLVLLVVWLSGVVLATLTGLLAVRLVGEQVGDASVPVLSVADVERALAAAPPAAPPPAPLTTPPPTTAPSAPPGQPPPPAPTTAAPPVTFGVPGGTLGVTCDGTTPTLLYATPAQGYRLDERSLEGSRLEVRFRGDDVRSRLTVDCASGRPVEQDRRVQEDGGGSG